MKRRELLSTLGTAGLVAATGCLADDDPAGEDADGATPSPSEAGPSTPATTPPESTSPTPSGSSPTPTESLTPPDVETPAPGECEAAAPPDPSPGEGLPDPQPYPDRPDAIDAETVGSFVEAYEGAYRYNQVLADLTADGACVKNLDAPVTDRTVASTADGVVGEVTTRGSYTGTTCSDETGTDTSTPLPHADLAFRTARYYVTDRFVMREGVVVECWGE